MPKKVIERINLGKVFLKPSQGIFGIRHAGRPAWDSHAETDVLQKIWTAMEALAPASMCVGHKGKDFFKCLKTQANAHLPYAGVSGIWYAATLGGSKAEALRILRNRFIYGWKSHKPDTAIANGRRIAHAILAGLSLQDAMNLFVTPVDMINEDIAKKSNRAAGGKLSDADIADIINTLKREYVDGVVGNFNAFRNSLSARGEKLLLPDNIKTERLSALMAVSEADLRTMVEAKLA